MFVYRLMSHVAAHVISQSSISKFIFTAGSIYASAVSGIVILSPVPLSVCLSVRLYVTRVLCDETIEYTADILILHERVISLVMCTFTWNLRLKWPTPSEKRRLRPISAYKTACEKCSIIVNRKLTTRFLTSYRWSAYVTPNSPKGWLKKRICRFCE